MITVARNAGFCFGVRRATDTVEKLISEKSEKDIICTFGKLIHNEQYDKYLKDNGVKDIGISDIDSLLDYVKKGRKVTVVIRTHGIPKEIQQELERAQKEYADFYVVDATCPFVKKIHKIASENSGEKEKFFLIGAKNHPEVLSILSYINGDGEVFANASELEEYLKRQDMTNFDIKMAAQTTQKLSEWKKCQEILKNYCTNTKIFDTICSVTEERQNEAEDLSEKCDVMLVIGGKESSNTSKLFDICSNHCKKTFWIQTSRDIPFDKIGKTNNIGITAGASTPDSLIQEVRKIMENENFEELLKESFEKEVKINKGATVTGTVMAIADTEIRLDLGGKLTGVITKEQITDDSDAKLDEMFKIGDEVVASVMDKSDKDGIAILSKKKIDAVKNWDKMKSYLESGEVAEAKVTEVTKGGVVVLIDGVKAFVPTSMTNVPKDGDLNPLMGTVLKVKVVEIKEDRKRVIASVKAVVREEKKAKEEAFWNNIQEGMEFEGPVKSITPYGAFVDLGGIDGLVHITELSWKRIRSPKEVVNVGDVIKVFVKSFDKEARKVSLGYKTEDQNPWTIFKSQCVVGDVIEVKIVGITSFGAFAEIIPGVDGLIHISQIADRKIDSVANVLKVGNTEYAKITGIDDDNKKVSLSIRALYEDKDPEEEAAETAETVEEAPETVEAVEEVETVEEKKAEEVSEPAEEASEN